MCAEWDAGPDATDEESTTKQEADGEFGGVCRHFCAAGGCCSRCAGCEESCNDISLKFGDIGAEKLSAELEQRAVVEAESLVTADGLICNERLALLRWTFDSQFVQRVLARVPFSSLLTLREEDWDGNALNTALLLEDFREIRLWSESSAATTKVYPVRLISIFDPHISLADKLELSRKLVNMKFKESHPKLEGSPPRQSKEATVAVNLQEFCSLFRSITHGLLERVPLHPDKLICSGGAMSWCVRCLTQKHKSLCQKEAEATHREAVVWKFMMKKVGEGSANLIWRGAFGGHDKSSSPGSAGSLRHKIREEMSNKGWEGADIDLFAIQDCAEDTVLKTVSAIERSVARITGGRETVTLRTKNTITVVGGWPFPNVQVVCKTVRSIQELVVHSDIDCTAIAFDGARVLASQRALRAISSGYNFIPKQIVIARNLQSSRSLARFGKYLRRGFGLLVFEHCRHVPRCDREVPSDSLEKIRRLSTQQEPQCKAGRTPDQNGSMLASWMRERMPEHYRKRISDSSSPENNAEATSGHSTASEGKRGHVLRNYAAFADLIIPCGKGVCPETLRAYVRHLERPDLLQEAFSTQVAVEPKTASDRMQWQDRLRGKCYMCKVSLQTKEAWPICSSCADFNLLKCKQMADCQDLVAVVTGGRTKIGREVALRLLRSGATVVVTSRFPRCTAERYSQEEDFANFKDRLQIQGADFRSLESVQRLVDVVSHQFSHIDILIHNAAQTIRRPPAYYESLIRKERSLEPLADGDQGLASASNDNLHFVDQALALLPVKLFMKEDKEAELQKSEWFPSGKTDRHGEQLDLRKFTSWTQKIEDTEMPELAEVLSINLVVPYLLTARWLPLMRASKFAFIIFVSSQEGSFSPGGSGKNSTHPQTNVAKAGLNMLAKTIAGNLRTSCIFTSAVDPGWVSWMQPGPGQATQQAPLTEADGAARVLDPIFSGMQALNAGRAPPSGVLFKDFRVAQW